MDAARAHVVVDMKEDENSWVYQLDTSLEDTDAWANRLKKKVEETKWRDDRNTICKVPHGLRTVDPPAYEPLILSLGPYHHGKPHLRAMDEHKWRYLKSFLCRNPERGLEDYLQLVANMEDRTRNAYSEATQMDSKHWVEMMLLDGCFAIEFLRIRMFGPNKFGSNATDSIQISAWVCPLVLEDMLLLENQLPFFLLKELLTFNSLPNRINHSLACIVLANFVNLMPGKIELSSVNDISDIHHILHLLYSCILPSNPGMGGETGFNNTSNILNEPSPLPGNPGMEGEIGSNNISKILELPGMEGETGSNNISTILNELSPLLSNPGMDGETGYNNISNILNEPSPLPSNPGMEGETGSNSINNILELPGMEGETGSNNISNILNEPSPLPGNPRMEGEIGSNNINNILELPRMEGETGTNNISNTLDEPSPLPGNPGMKGETAFDNISSISDEPILLQGNPTMEGETECHCICRISDKPIPLPWVLSVKNLKDAGVTFRKKTNMTSFIDITFQQGTLEIPPLKIIGQSLKLFRNLIAFELCYKEMGCPSHLASYAYLMHCIVNTPTDVDILQKKGIIVNALGNNDAVAKFFNLLCANVGIQVTSYLSGVFTDVQRHCDKRVNKWKASLNHNYLTNPWVIISVIAAIFLFLLTFSSSSPSHKPFSPS